MPVNISVQHADEEIISQEAGFSFRQHQAMATFNLKLFVYIFYSIHIFERQSLAETAVK